MGKMMRAVIVYDIEVDGSLKDAARLDDHLNDWAGKFNSYLSFHDPKLNNKITFTQICAAVPLQERRGSTGSLDDIVFRGSRGPNKKPNVGLMADMPKGSSPDQKKVLHKMKTDLANLGYDPARIQWYINEGFAILKFEGHLSAEALRGKLDLIERSTRNG